MHQYPVRGSGTSGQPFVVGDCAANFTQFLNSVNPNRRPGTEIA